MVLLEQGINRTAGIGYGAFVRTAPRHSAVGAAAEAQAATPRNHSTPLIKKNVNIVFRFVCTFRRCALLQMNTFESSTVSGQTTSEVRSKCPGG